MVSASKLQPGLLRDAAVVTAVAALVVSLGVGIFNLAAGWGAQPEEILGRLSQTPFHYRPPHRWRIAGMRTRAMPQTDALGAASIYLHEQNGSLENGAPALIQYLVMENANAARREWEGSIAGMNTETLKPRKLFELKGLSYPHLCVDEPKHAGAYCQVLVGEVWFEAYDRSGGDGACDCVNWMTKSGARHLEEIKASIGLW